MLLENKIAKHIYIYAYLRFGLDILIIAFHKLEEIYLLGMSYRQRMKTQESTRKFLSFILTRPKFKHSVAIIW